ncbi:MAG: hypothetical protein ABIV28_06595 [Longimicrobiales bacterium]
MRNRYRVVLECEVETVDMTPERMLELQEEREQHLRECESCRLAGPEEPASDESIAEQRALRRVLLENPVALDKWMRRELLIQLAEHGVDEAEPKDSESDILRPVIERLPAVLRHRYREAAARGELYDVAPEFFESFNVEIRDLKVERS